MRLHLTGTPGSALLALLIHTLVPAASAADKPTSATTAPLQRLQGTWSGVTLGPDSEDGLPSKPQETITVTITGNSFLFHRDTNFWFNTTIALPAGTDPMQLHATIKENAPAQGTNAIGKKVIAIFKVEGETLTVATRADGSDDVPTSFKEENITRYELKKAQPKGKGSPSPSIRTGNGERQ